MRSRKAGMLMLVVLVGMSVSFVSAQQVSLASSPMDASSEMMAQGGDGCDKALGAAIGFGLGALSPCSIICAIGGFYSIVAMGIMDC